MRLILFLALLLMMPLSVYAQEEEKPAEAEKAEETKVEEEAAKEEEEPDPRVTYSPDFCEFEITFPDAPYTARRCEDPQTKERCFDLVSYTQVYEMSSTVNFRVICNPVDESVYDDYSVEVMEATLKAMTKDSIVEGYKSSVREEEHYKQAGLVGEGKVGKMPTIYIAQLWIGKHSAFTVEAELIGQAHDAADKLFSDILKTVNYGGAKDLPEPKKTVPPGGN